MSEIIEVPINSDEIPEFPEPMPIIPEPEPTPKPKPRAKGRPKGSLGKKKKEVLPVPQKKKKRKPPHLQSRKKRKRKLLRPQREKPNNQCLMCLLCMRHQTQRLLPRKSCIFCPIVTWTGRPQNEKNTGPGSHRNPR